MTTARCLENSDVQKWTLTVAGSRAWHFGSGAVGVWSSHQTCISMSHEHVTCCPRRPAAVHVMKTSCVFIDAFVGQCVLTVHAPIADCTALRGPTFVSCSSSPSRRRSQTIRRQECSMRLWKVECFAMPKPVPVVTWAHRPAWTPGSLHVAVAWLPLRSVQ